MEHYDFAVLKGDDIVATARSIALPDLKAAWSHVEKMARAVRERGCKIRVTDKAGEIVILAGVALAGEDQRNSRLF